MKLLGFAFLGCLLIASCAKDDGAVSEQELDINSVSNTAGNVPDSVKENHLGATADLVLSESQQLYMERWQDFAFDLYRAAAAVQGNPKSLLVSPVSASFLLGMINEATQGQSSKELMDLLKCGTMDKHELSELLGYMAANLPKLDNTVKLKTANLVATDTSIELQEPFRHTMEELLLAETPSLDLGTTAATNYINDWCSKATDGLVPAALDRTDHKELAIFLNAVYLNAPWTEKFDPAQTQTEAFTSDAGGVGLPIMRQRSPLFPYMQNDLYSMLCLPLGAHSKWVMNVMLPNEGRTVDDVAGSMNGKVWREQKSKCKGGVIVDVKLPRFEAKYDIDLKSILRGMGASAIFSPQADFSPMSNGVAGLGVSRVFQKTVVKVTEEGAEMAAASGAALPSGTLAEVRFHATRPFLYVVEEASTGAILFIGTFFG